MQCMQEKTIWRGCSWWPAFVRILKNGMVLMAPETASILQTVLFKWIPFYRTLGSCSDTCLPSLHSCTRLEWAKEERNAVAFRVENSVILSCCACDCGLTSAFNPMWSLACICVSTVQYVSSAIIDASCSNLGQLLNMHPVPCLRTVMTDACQVEGLPIAKNSLNLYTCPDQSRSPDVPMMLWTCYVRPVTHSFRFLAGFSAIVYAHRLAPSTHI